MASSSRASSALTSRSPTPEPPVQPDHFWGQDDNHLPPSPHSNGRTWAQPEDDPLAAKGIPVFKPSMDEFRDFEEYMKRIEGWGMRSGIVKVIPPKEWTDALPPTKDQLAGITLKRPIEQLMLGRGGLFRQQNVEKRREMSVREWAELCAKAEYRAPGTKEVGRTHARVAPPPIKTRSAGRKRKATTIDPDCIKGEAPEDEVLAIPSPPNSDHVSTPAMVKDEIEEIKSPAKPRRGTTSKEVKEARAAEKAAADAEFLRSFDPSTTWLPSDTKAEDYTPEFCREIERAYWRNCGLGKPAWYGADTAGSLFTEATSSWNVGSLPSMLARLLPQDGNRLPGVNEPYLYFGMWRATFAWHVEDMDLFSINYIHFGAPKFWYAIPQGRSSALEQTMKSYFPKDIKQCPQFLRHKSFLASPTLLAQSSCRPNTLVQHAGEFVITYPHGYHAGFNLGFNCAESVNFALDSWLDIARKAKVCECVDDSVRIDVDALLAEREAEKQASGTLTSQGHSQKRKASFEGQHDGDFQGRLKKAKTTDDAPYTPLPPSLAKITSVKLKLGPRPIRELDHFPCCLCVSQETKGLLRVHDPPRDGAAGKPGLDGYYRAHDFCASVVPETWVDEVALPDGQKERVVFGVDSIVKDRWALKCTICTKAKTRAHGAPIQCTKGKCPKAFHVSCACESGSASVVFEILQQVEKEVVLNDSAPLSEQMNSSISIPLVDDPSGPVTPPLLGNSVSQTPQHNVLKTITKAEYQLLCYQHNPVVAEAKKQGKADRLRNQLASLPPMSRIKVRVSAGVFEVSLLRVLDEYGSVEVVWDKGLRREFKFSSIVLSDKPGEIVGYKPTEMAPESQYAPVAMTLPPPPPSRALAENHRSDLRPQHATSSAWSYAHYQPGSAQYATASQHSYGPLTYGPGIGSPSWIVPYVSVVPNVSHNRHPAEGYHHSDSYDIHADPRVLPAPIYSGRTGTIDPHGHPHVHPYSVATVLQPSNSASSPLHQMQAQSTWLPGTDS